MSFEYLDAESETLLKEILGYEQLPKHTLRGAVIKNLVELSYVEGKDVTTLSDIGTCYLLTGITQKGKSYFELKQKHEKEEKRLSRREWWIAIISALIGAIMGLMPSIIEWIK